MSYAPAANVAARQLHRDMLQSMTASVTSGHSKSCQPKSNLSVPVLLQSLNVSQLLSSSWACVTHTTCPWERSPASIHLGGVKHRDELEISHSNRQFYRSKRSTFRQDHPHTSWLHPWCDYGLRGWI